MLTKDDIVFQNETLLKTIYEDFSSLKENVVDTIFRLTNEVAGELGVRRVNKIIIRDKILFDNKRGAMFYKTGDVELSYQTVMALIQKDNEERYKSGVVTLRHELCHVLDREQILCKIPAQLSDEEMSGYVIWTEFFATYSTFAIKEDDGLYDALQKALNENGEKKYFISRVFGYYLSKGHSQRCDDLLLRHFDKTSISNIAIQLTIMLSTYPNIPISFFSKLNQLFDNILNQTQIFGEPIDDVFEWIRKKQK